MSEVDEKRSVGEPAEGSLMSKGSSGPKPPTLCTSYFVASAGRGLMPGWFLPVRARQ